MQNNTAQKKQLRQQALKNADFKIAKCELRNDSEHDVLHFRLNFMR